MDTTLSETIANYIEQRKQAKLEPFQKCRDKVLSKSKDPAEIEQANIDYKEAAAPFESAYLPKVWLTDAAKRAQQISLATHAAKFTHSDAKASSMLVNPTNLGTDAYVVTANLQNRAIDAVGNAAALDVARLLKLSVEGDSLVSQLQQKDIKALEAFTDDKSLLAQWQAGFEKALGDEKLEGHNLSKQLYFPLQSEHGTDPEYHLVCPLFPSSLAHELYHQVTQTRFFDSKDVREARKKDQYHSAEDQTFPRTAIQNFGGSKPQNISQLNSERYGQSFLLNCAPPSYLAQTKPPLTSLSVFNRQFGYATYPLVREFKTFLINLGEHERNFAARYKRDYGFVLPLIDELFSYAGSIQNMREHSGWASHKKCKLKTAHALWLDSNNPNSNFQNERAKREWLDVVARDFASWLSAKLRHDGYVLSDIEHSYFKKLCLTQLQEFERATPVLEGV
ncbi:MAG: type I-F CRISPR-associated protein Csy1 [Arenicella sp.]|nr:type I-F CRISPR-associated protein Csy1 [Arenicella sp.]